MNANVDECRVTVISTVGVSKTFDAIAYSTQQPWHCVTTAGQCVQSNERLTIPRQVSLAFVQVDGGGADSPLTVDSASAEDVASPADGAGSVDSAGPADGAGSVDSAGPEDGAGSE